MLQDFGPDHIHRWRDWCRLVNVHPVTAWRWVKAGTGPVVTRLGPKLKGIRHSNHLAWLAARERLDAGGEK